MGERNTASSGVIEAQISEDGQWIWINEEWKYLPDLDASAYKKDLNPKYWYDNQYPNKYSTPYHYTEDPEPKNILDEAHEAALNIGKLEHDTLNEVLYSLPTRNELLWKLNGTRTESKGTLTRIWNNVLRFSKRLVNKIYKRLPRKLQYVTRALKKLERNIHNKLLCFEPRLLRRIGKLRFPNHDMGKYNGMPVKPIPEIKTKFIDKIKGFKQQKFEFLESVDNPDAEDEVDIEYVNDCFDDMPRRMFGYSVKYNILNRTECSFGPNATVENRCIVVNTNTTQGLLTFLENQQQDEAQRRQTNEGFRTSAGLDCRVEAC